MRKLNSRCAVCGSGAIDSVVEQELRQFRFEEVKFACGATLKSTHTANGNIGRAILTECGATE